ncbi:TPA: hypothetical protein ACGOWW_001151 [Streptococcus suis]
MKELSKAQLVSIIGGGQLSSLIGLPIVVKGPGREIPCAATCGNHVGY